MATGTQPQAVGDGAGAGFAHLHLHTEYSLLDGGNRIDRLVARVRELGMNAVGVTDHGNLFGAVAFYTAAKEAGIKPILGVEAYVTPPDRVRQDRTYTGVVDGGYHLVLLAETLEGWRNLLVLCSEAYTSGFYYKPRVDRGLIEKHSAALIAINGHLGSEIGEHLLAFAQGKDEKHWDRAVESARWHAAVFGGGGAGPGFYIELQHHVPEQNLINPLLIKLARELGLPLVADNDAHFLRAEDHDAHDTLICISTAKAKSDQARMRYSPELYVKSPGQMRAIFEEYGEAGREACDNTVRIAERCNVELPLGKSHAPFVRVRLPGTGGTGGTGGVPDEPPAGADVGEWYRAFCAGFEVVPFREVPTAEDLKESKAECDEALRRLARAGLVWRYGSGQSAEIRERLERELRILCDKGISAYFLIVWDFVNWGRQHGIPALARGSGVGTMVGYVLGLSNACPVRYGLLFERFTDPDRSEYPDIDIDLCQDGRGAVIEYVRRKYGHVAQIITFGTLKARAAVRDVGRVMEIPLAEVDRLAKLIPEALGMTLDDALEQEPELKKLYDGEERIRRLIDNARTLEGQARHASVHAAGVIVATRPLQEIVPLYRQSGAQEHEIVTQWDGPTCEKMGLLKMDFLGLRTISVIERCKRLIRETLGEEQVWQAVGRGGEFEARQRGSETAKQGRSANAGSGAPTPHPLDLDRLTFDDPAVFALFQRGDTSGVFQFESPGMKRLLVDMKPDRLEDLIAANALFRPGPMDLIPDYNQRKHGQAEVPSIHPLVDRFTAETYGVMVYQEQVMQIVHELGGVPLRAAYSLIKAISKKKQKQIDAERPGFVRGAIAKGLSKSQAEDLFELILKFAGYGFNKSHSTGYAIVAYQTAYLKTYFPNQYMAAFLTYESAASKVSDWTPYLEDCKRARFTGGKVGVEVRPPDVNLSQADFSVVFDEGEVRDAQHGHVRFGLAAIKGAGEKAIQAIIEERDQGTRASRDQGKTYTSLLDFCERVIGRGSGLVNKATVEALVKSGAFDSVHGREQRAAMCVAIEQAMSAGQKAAQDRAAGQGALFGGGGGDVAEAPAPARLPAATPWSESETLAFEKEVLGFYVTSHPLDRWAAWMQACLCVPIAELRERPARERVLLGGMVQGVRTLLVKNGASAGQKMAVVTLEDRTGSIEAVLFADAYARYSHLLAEDAMVFLIGELDLARGEPQIKTDRVLPIELLPREPVRWLDLLFDAQVHNGSCEAVMERACGVLDGAIRTQTDGKPVPLRIFVQLPGGSRPVPIPVGPGWAVVPTPDLMHGLSSAVGEGCLRLSGPLLAREGGEERRWANGKANGRAPVNA